MVGRSDQKRMWPPRGKYRKIIMQITMVKKLFADGNPCRKCIGVEQKRREAGQLDKIDQVLVADEADPNSAGMLLAAEHGIDRAPFFIVEHEDQPTQLYTVYLKFVKEILAEPTSEAEEIQDIMDTNPDLDFI